VVPIGRACTVSMAGSISESCRGEIEAGFGEEKCFLGAHR
jgi:hypothetical protein